MTCAQVALACELWREIAPCVGQRTTRGERAAWWHLGEIRGGAWDRDQHLLLAMQTRCCIEEGERVGVARAVKEGLRAALLHDPAPVHHHDLVAQAGNQTQIVGDHQDTGPKIVLQLTQEAYDLGLYRHIKGGCGFVRNQQVGLTQQGHRDHDALTHAA